MATETIKRKGVDISTHNGNVNFKALQAAGVEFVIIRCGYGSDLKYQDDNYFEKNVKKAEAAGMPWGVYLYSYADSIEKAKSEAQHVKRLLGGRKPLYGVWYDIEDKIMPEQKKLLSDIVVTFCEAMEAEGLYVGVYSWGSWFNTRMDDRVEAYDKWICQWYKTCEYQGQYGIWQYTNELKIGGKRFDGNWAYKDYPAIIKAMSGGTKKEEATTSKAETKTEPKKETTTSSAASVYVEPAKSFSVGKAGTYKCTANLNLRTGASTLKKRIELMKKGTKVTCYGYYTKNWLLVKTEKGKTGFCSAKYLKKV